MIILPLEREPNNSEDRFAVAIKRRSDVVGHLPFNVVPVVSAFLRRGINKGMVEVTGVKVNRGGGYGLEVPCIYHFYGSIDKLKKLVDYLLSDGRL